MNMKRSPEGHCTMDINAFRIIVAGILLCVVGLVSGCGGGSSGGAASGGGGSDSRSVLLDSIAQKFQSFDGANPDNENQQLLAFLQSKPDFVDSGLSPTGGVWGRFADGTTLVIANNVDITQTRAELQPAPAPPPTRVGIPTTDTVILGAPLGTFMATEVDKMDEWFITQGYKFLRPPATVDTLKNMSNVGVLFLDAHGGAFPIRQGGAPVYITWTETLRAKDGSTDTKYAADLQDGSLTYFMGLAINGSTPVRVAETHYGITAKFASKYWTGKFNQNSLVFINACHSADFLYLDFEQACINAGASVYMGWSDSNIIRDGLVTAYYLFDRMLGANQFDDKESPPQRPFSWTSVLADMHSRKRPYTDKTGHQTNYDQSYEPTKGTTANLIALGMSGNFLQLAPSIESLSVDAQKDEIAINGTFGDTKGSVQINGGDVTVKSWSNTQIVCDLPRSGASASGDVVVISPVQQSQSNPVPLTEWNGNVTCTMKDKGALKLVMNFHLHFRADVHDRRIAAHQTPFMPGANFANALDSTATFKTDGNYTSPDLTYSESWDGAGSVPPYTKPDDPTAKTNFVINGSIDANRNWTLGITALVKAGNQVHIITRDMPGGPITSDTTTMKDIGWTSVGDMKGGLTLATLGNGYSVPAGSASTLDGSMTIDWTAMTPNHPPDASAARSVKVTRHAAGR